MDASYIKSKSSYIVAAIVIFLCLIAITGATFALFTDENDGKIGVNATSGNLEVDIFDASDNPQSILGETLGFLTQDGTTLFEPGEVLFEPGAVFCTEGFRVMNTGNISLSYIIYISEDKDNKYYSADFSEAFEVWITTDHKTANVGKRLYEFEGSLEPGYGSDVYYLVFRMKESAGNEFQNRTFSGIGITVCAVQGNGYTEKGEDYVNGNN